MPSSLLYIRNKPYSIFRHWGSLTHASESALEMKKLKMTGDFLGKQSVAFTRDYKHHPCAFAKFAFDCKALTEKLPEPVIDIP